MASQDSTTEGSKSPPSYENQKTLHSRSPAPSEEIRPLSSSESKYDDELEFSTPLPKTDQQRKKDKKKKKHSPPDSVSNKTAISRMPVKRRREEQQEEVEDTDGMREPPSKKKTPMQLESPAKKNTNKKPRKREPVCTPPSSQKAVKKVGRIWSPEDELVFFNGLLEFYKRGKVLPKNMAPVYDHIRNTLDNQYSNRQFADKASRWKCKFRTSVDREKAITISFRSPHDAAVYNICKQIWGGQDDYDAENKEINDNHSVGGGNAVNVGTASMDDKKKKRQPVVPKEEVCEEDMKETEDQEDEGDKKEEEEDEDQEDQRGKMEGEEDEDQEDQGGKKEEEEDEHQEDQGGRKEGEEDEDQENQGVINEEEGEVEDGVESKKAVDTNMVQNIANDLAKPKAPKVAVMSSELYSKFSEERDAMIAGLKVSAAIMLKESELKTRTMIEDHFNTKNDHRQLPNNTMINGFHSARGAPVLSRVRAEALEEKWRVQQILEIEAYCKRLDLLQDECNMCLEELEASARNVWC